MARVDSAKKFYSYCNRVFDIDQWFAHLNDRRKDPKYALGKIVLALGVGFVVGLDSMERLAKCIERGNFKAILGNKAFSADTIARGLSCTDFDELRLIYDDVLHKARNGKMLINDTVDGFKVVAIDGLTLYSTKSERLGQHSHYRRDAHGEETKLAHYYENAVAIATVSEHDAMHLVYRFDRIPKGKGETTAAMVAIKELYKEHPGYCDFVTVDAGYAKAPILNLIGSQNKWFVVRVKQEAYNIIKDADGLFACQEPACRFTNMQLRDGTKYWYDVEIWEDEDFTSWEALKMPLRCLKVREVRKTRDRTGKYHEEAVVETHLVTNAPMVSVMAKTIWKIAHLRWDVENNVINTLKNAWNLKHAFSYDCDVAQKVWEIAVLFYNLFQCFTHRNLRQLKQEAKRHIRDSIFETLIIWSSKYGSLSPLANTG